MKSRSSRDACECFASDLFETIQKVDIWKQKENKIALLQSLPKKHDKQVFLQACILQLEGEKPSTVELNTPIAAAGLPNTPVCSIHSYAYQQDHYQVTFGTLAGKQYTLSIPTNATIDQLATEMKEILNQDRDQDDKKQYWHIAYGDNNRISPLQAADRVSTLFNPELDYVLVSAEDPTP